MIRIRQETRIKCFLGKSYAYLPAIINLWTFQMRLSLLPLFERRR